MKRSWNPILWGGFVLVLVGTFSYPAIFVRFPATRDFPWANLLIIAAALVMVWAGIARAFRRADRYRGKIGGSILGVLTVLLVGFFLYGIFYATRQIPASHGAPQVGHVAPDFTLPDSRNNPVSLSALETLPFSLNGSSVSAAGSDKTAAVVLIFYRGYW